MRICFVCQSGVLEPKAILLAASLRLYFPQNVELIAAHPTLAGPLRTETLKALAALDVGKNGGAESATARLSNRS
jgi:hypothetical protein